MVTNSIQRDVPVALHPLVLVPVGLPVAQQDQVFQRHGDATTPGRSAAESSSPSSVSAAPAPDRASSAPDSSSVSRSSATSSAASSWSANATPTDSASVSGEPPTPSTSADPGSPEGSVHGIVGQSFHSRSSA